MRKYSVLSMFLLLGLFLVAPAKADGPSVMDAAAGLCASGRPELEEACNFAANAGQAVLNQAQLQSSSVVNVGSSLIGLGITQNPLPPLPLPLPPQPPPPLSGGGPG